MKVEKRVIEVQNVIYEFVLTLSWKELKELKDTLGDATSSEALYEEVTDMVESINDED